MWSRALFLLTLPVCAVLLAALHRPPPQTPPDYHLVKTDRDGRAMDAWSGPWSCVCDTRTGLLWEVKTDDEGIHDGHWTYSWYERDFGVADNGDCYFEEERCDTRDLIRRTNREKLCDAGNWRLPDSEELQTLLYPQARTGAPLIDTAYFPKTRRGDYWTGEGEKPLRGVYRYLNNGAAAIDFIAGEQVTIPYRNAAFVRLVADSSKACNQNPEILRVP